MSAYLIVSYHYYPLLKSHGFCFQLLCRWPSIAPSVACCCSACEMRFVCPLQPIRPSTRVVTGHRSRPDGRSPFNGPGKTMERLQKVETSKTKYRRGYMWCILPIIICSRFHFFSIEILLGTWIYIYSVSRVYTYTSSYYLTISISGPSWDSDLKWSNSDVSVGYDVTPGWNQMAMATYHLDDLVQMFARWVDPRDNFKLEGSGLRKKACRFHKTLSSSSQ